jgi:hypothetical protein
MTWAVVLFTLVAVFRGSDACGGQEDREQTKRPAESEGNALCYTCHLGLQREAITADHIAAGITCRSCHGLSVEHMHDEMQVTSPDRLFGRGEVDKMCSACHEGHADAKKVEVFRKRWLGKTRPNGRVITKASVCTDCHGSHNYIAKARGNAATESSWIPLFNGRDLEGWEASEEGGWAVRSRRLTAVANASRKPSCIVTENEYADFQISITFRADWPVNAWVSLRQTDDACGPRIMLGDSPASMGRPGSIWASEKMPALVNLREDTVDRLMWNTMLIEARQNQYSTSLNGEEIGRVHLDGPSSGKIGIHMEEHAGSKEGRLQISEIDIKVSDTRSEKENNQTSGDAL